LAQSCDAIIIGAGPAGLAAAACLKARGFDAVILEKANSVGSVWRRHYDRLHLHTDRSRSGLPGMPIPKEYGRYPSRAQVVTYLEAYAATHGLKPIFNTKVSALRREGDLWRAEAAAETRVAPVAVVATGLADFPHSPSWPGLETFGGPIVHSSAYRNPAPYAGKRVLVVGYGNSGAEIALDLAQAGVPVAVSVRSPINVIPREILGVPILAFGLAGRLLPPHAADKLNAPILRLATGDVEKLGFTRSSKGPLQTIAEDGHPPLIDIGTLAAVRDGRIVIRGDVARFEPGAVVFKDARSESFDAVILATGFRPDLRSLLPDAKGVLTAAGTPLTCGRPTAEPGLFFCGAITSPLGQLRQIAIDAQGIADAVAPRHAARSA
jgi:thioredoxin reductase